jgi:hypothetical protein
MERDPQPRAVFQALLARAQAQRFLGQDEQQRLQEQYQRILWALDECRQATARLQQAALNKGPAPAGGPRVTTPVQKFVLDPEKERVTAKMWSMNQMQLRMGGSPVTPRKERSG